MIATNNQAIDVQCDHCGITYSMLVDKDDIMDWILDKGYIQELMPYLSASERELLISGTCNNCWKMLYGETEEEG